ncbi:MAG: replication-associated recombination protein A [Eubacteriaceae bacterium]|nr:replication-associated recombination protein A [Eubacteriaceae bacterium]
MQDSFIDHAHSKLLRQKAPLAERMRPQSLSDFRGQESLIGSGKQLSRMIESDKISSIILYGPPGSGKTTLANIIALSTACAFVRISATSSGASDIRTCIAEAKRQLSINGKGTILFIDEIHRFNKTQQDTLLPAVENGTVVLIGATTENPYFEVNSALISRSTIFRLEKLSEADIGQILARAISDKEAGYGNMKVHADREALEMLSSISGGDARIALNSLESLVALAEPDGNGEIHISVGYIESFEQQNAMLYDKSGQSHYDTISAFIKSLRGSDPDAALYWMAKMLDAGEDPKFIARRMVIFASEDVGNAEPHGLMLAVSAFQAVEQVGLPECRYNLAQAATFLACCPKSNASGAAFFKALGDIHSKPVAAVPIYLRDGAGTFGSGEGYKYPHEYPKHYVEQDYLPSGNYGPYYQPTQQGHEKRLAAYLSWIHESEPKQQE